MATERKTEFVFCISKRESQLSQKRTKKKIPSGLVEVSNSFDIIFGLFSALFPSDFIWKKNTLFSWPMRTEGHFKDVQQCSNDLETQHWNGSNLIGSVSHGPDERHLFENHLAINGAWIGVFPSIVLEQFVRHRLIWISEETQQEKIHAKNTNQRGLELTPWVVRKRCDWNRKW